jgi:xanthine/uracil permease
MRFDSARADRITAAALFALGIAMLWGGWTMDRLELRQIHPASIPGLVPMLLGAALAACAALLFAGARDDAEPDAPEFVSWSSMGVALLLSLIYALILVGRLPFFWATALYIAAFVAYFTWRDAEGEVSRTRVAVTSVLFAVVVSGAVGALFRYGFLVRLP